VVRIDGVDFPAHDYGTRTPEQTYSTPDLCIVFAQFPDEDAPAGRGRLNDTRVAAKTPLATGSPPAPGPGSSKAFSHAMKRD
jgi:hypothetical protein